MPGNVASTSPTNPDDRSVLSGPQFKSVDRAKREDDSGAARAAKIGISEQDAYDERRWSRYE